MQVLRRSARIGLLLGLLALGFALVALLLLGRAASAATSLEAARARWEQQGPQFYQLHVLQKANATTCEQEIAVDNERSGVEQQNTCVQAATWTVSRLFTWIGELQRSSANCYPTQAMCACRASIRTAIVYDEQLGYPREILYEWRKLPNLTSPDYYRSLFDQTFPGCDKDGTGGPVTIDITLSPVP